MTRQQTTVYRTGTEQYTITEAHPYHIPVGTVDHHSAGTYTVGFDPSCPRCRQDTDTPRAPDLLRSRRRSDGNTTATFSN